MSQSTNASGGGRTGERFAYVLDDEARVGTIVCQILTSNGYVARQFSSPMPFLAEVRATPPEVVVLDLALGQSDAVDVIRHLDVLKYRGKTLLMSGQDQYLLGEIERIGLHHGLAMLPSLTKPFRAHELKDRLGAATNVQLALPEAGPSKVAKVDLGEALRQSWLELWYQPKIDLKTLSVCGAEALLRARHPTLGIVPPASLLPQAGDRLYLPLSRFVIGQAMADWEQFAQQQLPLKLAVNIPVSVLLTPDFIRVVREFLPRTREFPGLIVEVTEDEIIRDAERIREVVTQLKLYNVRISIDDFGTGYSSLSRLRDLPCVELKLDRGFVSNCAMDGSKQSLCAAAIDLAHGFGLSVCAEGVETVEDLRALIDMRCDTAQGYLFAKPMSPTLLVDMLLAQKGEPQGKSQSSGRLAGDGMQLVKTV